MANRYAYNGILSSVDTKKQYLESTIYPKIKPTDDDLYIISEAGDRLDLLAHKYYNDKTKWWIIATANNINDATFYVEAGLQLRIPSNISGILNDLEKINK
jgi:nucleoid-associated protein YgaU